jgi:hypothetical protein
MPLSRTEPVSDDGAKKDGPASAGGSSDPIRQVPPELRPGYGNEPLLLLDLLLLTTLRLQER